MKIKDANLKFRGSLSDRSSTRIIVIHHAAAKSCTAKDIHSWHLANGWAGAGYHYFVRKDGSVWRMRPEGKIGAHAQGANGDSIGICFEGDYSVEKSMADAQLKAGRELIADIQSRYGGLKVVRHKDVSPTDCPAKYFPWEKLTAKSGEKHEGARYIVTASALNVRNRRSTVYGKVVGSLANGEHVYLTNVKKNSAGNTWGDIAEGKYKGGHIAVKFHGSTYARKG